MAAMTGKERRRLDAVHHRNRELWAAGEMPVAELYYLELLDAAIARSGLTVPPLYPVGSAANAGLLYVLFRLLQDFPGLDVLECGAGQSSLLLDALAKAGRAASITTLEHDAVWADRVGAQVAHEVRTAPLQPAMVLGVATEIYDVDLTSRFDIVLVDGPVGTRRHSRWGTLALLEQHLAPDFAVIFDDAERPGERDTIARFLDLHPTAGHAFVHAAKSQCLVFTGKYQSVASY